MSKSQKDAPVPALERTGAKSLLSRREFLKAATALYVGGLVPTAVAIPYAPPFTLANLRIALESLREPMVMGEYLCFVHPSCEADLRTMAAREEWTYAWRAARLAGERDLAPREILERFPPTGVSIHNWRIRRIQIQSEGYRMTYWQFIGTLALIVFLSPLIIIATTLFWMAVASALDRLDRKLNPPSPPSCDIDPRCHPAYARASDGSAWIGNVRVS